MASYVRSLFSGGKKTTDDDANFGKVDRQSAIGKEPTRKSNRISDNKLKTDVAKLISLRKQLANASKAKKDGIRKQIATTLKSVNQQQVGMTQQEIDAISAQAIAIDQSPFEAETEEIDQSKFIPEQSGGTQYDSDTSFAESLNDEPPLMNGFVPTLATQPFRYAVPTNISTPSFARPEIRQSTTAPRMSLDIESALQTPPPSRETRLSSSITGETLANRNYGTNDQLVKTNMANYVEGLKQQPIMHALVIAALNRPIRKRGDYRQATIVDFLRSNADKLGAELVRRVASIRDSAVGRYLSEMSKDTGKRVILQRLKNKVEGPQRAPYQAARRIARILTQVIASHNLKPGKVTDAYILARANMSAAAKIGNPTLILKKLISRASKYGNLDNQQAGAAVAAKMTAATAESSKKMGERVTASLNANTAAAQTLAADTYTAYLEARKLFNAAY